MNEPKLTPQEHAALVDIFKRAFEIGVGKVGANKTCLSCCHFQEGADVCTFYTPAMRPPARVIVTACPAWQGEPF